MYPRIHSASAIISYSCWASYFFLIEGEAVDVEIYCLIVYCIQVLFSKVYIVIFLLWISFHFWTIEISVLQDAEAYAYLLKVLAPEHSNPSILTVKDALERAKLVLEHADKMGCKRYLTARDIVEGSPNLNLAFVAHIFQHRWEYNLLLVQSCIWFLFCSIQFYGFFSLVKAHNIYILFCMILKLCKPKKACAVLVLQCRHISWHEYKITFWHAYIPIKGTCNVLLLFIMDLCTQFVGTYKFVDWKPLGQVEDE